MGETQVPCSALGRTGDPRSEERGGLGGGRQGALCWDGLSLGNGRRLIIFVWGGELPALTGGTPAGEGGFLAARSLILEQLVPSY